MVNKIDLEDLYVGEIHIAQTYYNKSSWDKINLKEQKFNSESKKLLKKGAIKLEPVLPSFYFDKSKNWLFARVLSLLKLEKNDKVISLHTDSEYKENGINFYKNLVPFSNYFPKLDVEVPYKMDKYEANRLFTLFFNKIEFFKNSLYYRKTLDLKDLYVATLRVLSETYKNYGTNMDSEYFNVNERLILERIGIRQNNTISIVIPDGNRSETHVYNEYNCLLYKDVDCYQNLNNFQSYDLDDKNITNMISFEEVLDNNRIGVADEISIPKALNLYRRLR